MKNKKQLVAILIVLSGLSGLGQPQPATTPPESLLPTRTIGRTGRLPNMSLTPFKLEFLGGTPRQLVAALEKAVGKPLNVIIPEDLPEVKLPPLKMNNVDVSDVFNAVNQLGRFAPVQYNFQTGSNVSDDSVWTFHAFTAPSGSPNVCRFYSLTPYLERGLTVDDILMAVQLGWSMLGEKPGDKGTPTFKFHKETKLLIAVGEPSKLETIDAVLKALLPSAPVIDPATGLPMPTAKPAEKSKSKN